MGEIASRRIVKDNQKKIVENLIEGKIMFEDQFEDPITRTTVAEIRRIIEEEYGLEEESISYMEIPINGEWKYVFWRNVEENVISLDDIKEMARIHFTKSRDSAQRFRKDSNMGLPVVWKLPTDTNKRKRWCDLYYFKK